MGVLPKISQEVVGNPEVSLCARDLVQVRGFESEGQFAFGVMERLIQVVSRACGHREDGLGPRRSSGVTGRDRELEGPFRGLQRGDAVAKHKVKPSGTNFDVAAGGEIVVGNERAGEFEFLSFRASGHS